jgi:hypothetical protein
MAQEELITLVTCARMPAQTLLVHCEAINCNHSSSMNADHLPDDLPVRSLFPHDLSTVWASGS